MNKEIIVSVLALFFAGAIFFHPVEAAIPPDPAFLIDVTATSFLPSTIHAGDTVSMAVDIKNKGITTSIESLSAELDLGNQFEAIDVEDSISQIKPGATKTLVFKFMVKEETFPGHYPVFLAMNYPRAGETATESQSILVSVSATEKNIDVTLEPRVINPGNQTGVFFALKNVGGTSVSNISFSWEEANDLVLPVGSDNKRYISILQPNEEKKVSYTVAADPNIEPGIYPLDITMKFIDVNGTKTQASQIGLIVGGTTDFEVSAEILSSGQLSISIANVGSNNAGAVVVRVPEQPGISVSGSNTAILGNLNKGDFTLANFQARTTGFSAAASTATGFRQRMAAQPGTTAAQSDATDAATARATANSLLVEIDYTDTTGERQSVQKETSLTPAATTTDGTTSTTMGFRNRQANTYGFIPWILLAVFLGGAAAFNKYRAGNRDWKKLAKLLAIIAVLFLAVIFLFGSDLIAAAVVSVISAILLAWFFGLARFFRKQKK